MLFVSFFLWDFYLYGLFTALLFFLFFQQFLCLLNDPDACKFFCLLLQHFLFFPVFFIFTIQVGCFWIIPMVCPKKRHRNNSVCITDKIAQGIARPGITQLHWIGNKIVLYNNPFFIIDFLPFFIINFQVFCLCGIKMLISSCN